MGSKAYKSNTTGANVHVTNMYGTEAYTLTAEDENGEWFEDRFSKRDRRKNYYDALATARGWMMIND
jgi:hypothetical protein